MSTTENEVTLSIDGVVTKAPVGSTIRDAADTVGIWSKIYKFQLGSHGMGAATARKLAADGKVYPLVVKAPKELLKVKTA